MLSISTINKKLKANNKLYWSIRELYVFLILSLKRLVDKPKINHKKRILFYHINSLGFAGTEKFIQILAKYLDKNIYDVFYLYPNNLDTHSECIGRLNYIIKGGVTTIPFDFDNVSKNPPYFVSGMNPDIKKIIKTLNIDLLVLPDAGGANYPFSIIKNIPILLLNIFGVPNLQKNIKFHLCISKEVARSLLPIVPDSKIYVFYVPSEEPTPNSIVQGNKIREQFNIKDGDFVFGRIGRPDNNIFDPIGINAFKMTQVEYPNTHYIIMAPPPVLVEIVNKENIKNVHFLEPSSDEDTVWAFHQSIDALAHFRMDGESFGLNIVESMLCGKPIISHRSHVWNAHSEYLESSFSRLSEKDDVNKYVSYMKEFIQLKTEKKIDSLRKEAKKRAETFLIKNKIREFEEIVSKSLL